MGVWVEFKGGHAPPPPQTTTAKSWLPERGGSLLLLGEARRSAEGCPLEPQR